MKKPPLRGEALLRFMHGRRDEIAAKLRKRSLPVLAEITRDCHARSSDYIAGVWAKSAEPAACARGCAHCCHIRVSVSVPEVLLAVDFAKRTLAAEALDRVRARAKSNAERARGTSSETYPHMPCAFLGDDGACAIYEARPFLCRADHAYDAEACRRAIMEDDRSVQGRTNNDVRVVSAIEQLALREALAARRVRVDQVEFQQALHIALSDDTAGERWLAGEDVFATAAEVDDAGMV